jgi:tRNA-Thr(GGU) m(6)t(6)A37 methyltransferase TsaA
VTSSSDPSVTPIGVVRSTLVDVASAPKQGDEGAPAAWIDIDPVHAVGVQDLEEGVEVLVLTWLDRADRTALLVRPRDDPGARLTGVFSTRSADRPNPIGIHRVRLLRIDGTDLLVSELEAVDGTPVLDIKPVLDRSLER